MKALDSVKRGLRTTPGRIGAVALVAATIILPDPIPIIDEAIAIMAAITAMGKQTT